MLEVHLGFVIRVGDSGEMYVCLSLAVWFAAFVRKSSDNFLEDEVFICGFVV